MQEKYKYMFFKYICVKLNLFEFDKKIEDYGINNINEEIEGMYKDLSKYFSLVNKVDDTRLTGDLRKQYEYYFSLPIEQLYNLQIQNDVFKFLESTYKIMLFPNIKENHCYYGPLSYNYLAPRDSVVLGFNYYEFDIPDENFDKLHYERNVFLCQMINHIQITLSQQIGIPITIIKYNEYSKKKVNYSRIV